jgi:hypothetical protein
MKNILLTLVIMVFITGCKEKKVNSSSNESSKNTVETSQKSLDAEKKKVDSSSDESFKNTVETVKKSLDVEKKKSFDDAIQTIAMSEIGNIFEVNADPNRIAQRIKDKLNGKTADEIIADSNRIIAEREEKEREQANIEIAEVQKKITELEAQRKKAEQDKEELKKLIVVRSQFYFSKGMFSNDPVIELTVKNNTTYAISRAYFDGVLATPGRSVPWVKDSFSYKISGGLEPGEEATWKLAPNMFGEWSKAPEDRNDMVLTVTVTRIDGADEKAIFDSEFSTLDEFELKKLNERLEELKKTLGK